MNLEIIRTQTTWNDAAGSINNNYAKIADAIAQLKANGGGGVSYDRLDSWADYTSDKAGYVLSALLGYDLNTRLSSVEGDYATKDYVTTKLLDYAPLTSVQGFENRIAGLEGAVPQLNERVTTVEGEVSTLNEIVSTGENNLLDRVNVIEEEYATKTYVDNAIVGIDLSPYLKTEDAEETYATKDFVTTKLLDYAPLTSVQGFENRIAGLEGAVPQLNERVTTVEGEVSTLNEIVSTGENNLLDRVNTIETDYVTSGNLESAINGIDLSAYLLKADLTKSRIQSTLGISDWALAATKPNYAWSEITSRPTALSQFTDDIVAGKYLPLSKFQVAEVADPSTVYLQSGIYRQSADLGDGTSGWAQFITLFAGGDNWAQMYFSYDGRLHYRAAAFADRTPENTPWTAIITEKNIGNYKSGDSAKLGGYDISRFLLTTKRDDTTMDLNTIGDKQSIFTEIRTGEVTTLNCPISGYGALLSLKDGNSFAKMQIVSASRSADTYIRCRQGSGSTISANWQRIITDNNIGNYNAGSATKLQTPRKLWGNDFDGTGDVSGTFRQLYTGSYDGAVAHSILCNINGPHGLITRINSNGDVLQQAQRENTEVEWFNFILQPLGGNVGIGNTSPAERLDVSGNIKASGNINATSITINGVTITASNGSITVNGNVFATGDITGCV